MLPNVHCITLRETPDKTSLLQRHLHNRGILQRTMLRGINANKWGLTTIHQYMMDGPEHVSTVDPKHVGLHLSHYFAWSLQELQGWEEMTILEDDCRFDRDWKPRYETARAELPDDWDILLLGSAHTQHRNKVQINNSIWECWWPLTTHAYIVRKKALPVLMESQEYAWAPIDISLTYRTYPRLRVYTVLPRLAYQEWMPLDP